jgi:hypothetical protein
MVWPWQPEPHNSWHLFPASLMHRNQWSGLGSQNHTIPSTFFQLLHLRHRQSNDAHKLVGTFYQSQLLFITNCCPLPPPPPLPLLLGRHPLHRHHHAQTHRCPLPKKEATAAAPPAYQRQQQCEKVYKSRRLGRI